MDSKNVLSIWLVVGISLLVNGVLILGAGLYELIYPPVDKVVLWNLHASIWWGALMAIIGLVYCIRFAPKRQKAVMAVAVTASQTKESHVS